jgi:lipopolysaccharide biosynthesis glycosyltransferase
VPDTDVYAEFAKYGKGWAGEAYYSLCAHLLLPKDIDRALYLDAGDTLVVNDIEPYYNCDFQGKSLMVTSIRYKIKNGIPELLDEQDLGNREENLPGILRGFLTPVHI